MDNGRIMKELKELTEAAKSVSILYGEQVKQNTGPQVNAKVIGDNIRHWKGTIYGPVSTLIYSQLMITLERYLLRRRNFLS